MAEFSNNSWLGYILPFIVPGLTALIFFVKKQGAFETRGSLTDYNVATIRTDLAEVKSDIKEIRKDQSDFGSLVQEIKNFSERVKRLENILDDHDKRLWPQLTGALRQIDIIKVRLDNVEKQLDQVRNINSSGSGGGSSSSSNRRSSRNDAMGGRRYDPSSLQYEEEHNNNNDHNNPPP